MVQIILYADNIVIEVIPDVRNPIKTIDGVKWDDGELAGIKVDWCVLHGSVSIEVGEEITDEFITANKVDVQLSEIELLKRQQTDLVFEMLMKGVLINGLDVPSSE